VDDASTDDSLDIVRRQYPKVRIIQKHANTGFGDTANMGVAHARGEIVVLLNNDLVPREPMMGELIAPLAEDVRLFGVTGRTMNWRATEADHVSMAGQWRDGEFHLSYDNAPEPSSALFLLGGCCAFRRTVFISLGGFCSLFSPGYWEDYDLSYQAAKCGWKVLYNPRAEAYHFGSVSMNQRHGAAEVRAIRARNRILFQWLNFTDPEWLSETENAVARRFYRAACGDEDSLDWVRGFQRARPMLNLVESELRRRSAYARRLDRDILADFLHHGQPV
jgi:GT2 family glycosyltransferase